MKRTIILAATLGALFATPAVNADCPDVSLVCKDDTVVNIGTCWNMGHLSCEPCSKNFAKKCQAHGGAKCYDDSYAGVRNVAWALFKSGGQGGVKTCHSAGINVNELLQKAAGK